MNYIKQIFIFIVIFQLSTSTIAREMIVNQIPVNPDSAKNLEESVAFEMKFHNLLLNISNEIDRDLDGVAPELIEERNMDEILRRTVGQFSDFYENSNLIPKTNWQKIKKVLNSDISHKKIMQLFKNVNIGAEVFFKKHGVGISIAILLGYVCDFLVLSIAGGLGLKTLMGLSPFIPYSFAFSLIPNTYRHLQVKYKLIKKLGGKKAYHAYRQQIKLTAKELHLGDPYRVIFPSHNYLVPIRTVGDVVESAVIPKSAKFAGLAGKMGIDIKSLNYKSLILFLTTNNISNERLRSIRKNKTLSNWQKTAAIIDNLVFTQDDEMVIKLKKRFSSSFIEVKNLKYWKDLRPWTHRMSQLSSMDDIKKLLKEIPEFVDTREVMILWKRLILPQYAESMNINYFQYRRLIEDADILEGKARAFGGPWNEEFHQEFLETISRGLRSVHFSKCPNKHETVLLHLIRGL